ARFRLTFRALPLAELVGGLLQRLGGLVHGLPRLAGLPLAELFAGLAHLPLRLFHRPAGLRGAFLGAGQLPGRVRSLLGGGLHRCPRTPAPPPRLIALALATGFAGGLHLVAGPLGAAGRIFHLRAGGSLLTPGVAGQVFQLPADVAGFFLELLLPASLL